MSWQSEFITPSVKSFIWLNKGGVSIVSFSVDEFTAIFRVNIDGL